MFDYNTLTGRVNIVCYLLFLFWIACAIRWILKKKGYIYSG